MNLSGATQKNFSCYNKDNIDLNRFFEKMTFQDLYNDYAEENTPTQSTSQACTNDHSQFLQNQCSMIQTECNSSQTLSQNQNYSQNLPLQEHSNNYQNMNYRHKVSLQSQSSFCSQNSTSTSYTSSSGYSQSPFSNITNLKNNNNTTVITSANTPSNYINSQLQQNKQKQQQQVLFHKQNSVKMEKKIPKQIKLKNSIDSYFSRPLDAKLQQKLTFETSYFATVPTLTQQTHSNSTRNQLTNSDQTNIFDLFSQTNGNSCYSLFMSQQNSSAFSECDTNQEFFVY